MSIAEEKAVPTNSDNHSQRSEEVQAIIERMPTYWAKWVALCASVLMGIVILLGFLIGYSDTVDGRISVTSTVAPVRMVAGSNGRLLLLKVNNDRVQAGEIVGYIESGANYRHVLQVDELLHRIGWGKNATYPLPDSLLLGEVSSAYNSFLIAFQQYERLCSSDIYATMRKNIRQQISADDAVADNLNKELKLRNQIFRTSQERLKKDSVLLEMKGISQKEYEQLQATHSTQEEALLNLQSNYLTKQSEVVRNRLEIERISLEERENKDKAETDLIARLNELFNAISLWKERYLLTAPVEGNVEYLGFWRNNTFVQSGQELFSIVPRKNDIVGEVMIPTLGAGKVKIGQDVNVKMDNYPYDEYGQLKGKVKSISRISNKLQTQEGTAETYRVQVYFPDGFTTNFGKLLPLDFESKGSAEIITKRKKLIERLFDNLKSKTEK